MKTRDLGFGTMLAIVTLLIIGLAGFGGWKIWQNHRASNSSSSQNQSTKTVSCADKGPCSVLSSYSLPQGWKTIECEKGTLTLLVPGETNETCSSGPISNPEDAKSPDSAYLGVVLRDLHYLDPTSCVNTLKMRNGSNSIFPSNEYSCQDVTIDGVKGIRQVGTHTTQSFQAYGIPSVTVFYDFPTTFGYVLEASYTHYSESPYPDLTHDFDSFVKSFAFKQ